MAKAGNLAPGGRQRLDSWKEIAAFFGRDERTVNRWEKELGLPVRRMPGRAKGPVYAYADELAAWMTRPNQQRDSGPHLQPVEALVAPETTPAPISSSGDATPTTVNYLTETTGGSRARPAIFARSAWFAAAVAFTVAAIFAWPLGRKVDGAVSKSAGNGTGQQAGVVQASAFPHNPEAEQLYLQGRYYWNKRTPEDLTRAQDYFMQAIVKDPGYAKAYVGLADCYNLMREYTLMPASEAYPRALAAAQKAVELDDQSSEAHASMAFALFWGKWDFATADREFERAIALDASNAVAHHWYATYLAMVKRYPESLAEIDRAQALDPASTAILADKGAMLYASGRIDESRDLLRKLEATSPTFVSLPRYLKFADFAEGDYPGYLAEWRKEAQLLHDGPALAEIADAERGYAAGGVNGMLAGTLRAQKKQYALHQLSPYQLARTLALTGERQQAEFYLAAAYRQHDASLLSVAADPALASLRDDAAYRDLLEQMKFPKNI